MNLHVQQQPLTSLESDLVVVPLAQGEQSGETVQILDRALNEVVREQIGRSGFVGKEGETLLFHTHGRLPSRSVLLLGLGKSENVETETWRRMAGKVQREARSQGARNLAWFLPAERGHADVLVAVAEGTWLSGYTFDKYKSDKNGKPAVETLTLAGTDLQRTPALSRALEVVQKTAPGVFLARDLVNEPASVSTPRYLAEQAVKLSRGNGLKSDIWGLNRVKTAKLAGLLAVARGSVEEPRFIKLSYKPGGKPRKKIALVGKGLTFDSGGLSLKPAKSMETMKLDMSGGATVLGVMQAISQLKPHVQVTGYIPATENMPSGTAQKPGDIICFSWLNQSFLNQLNVDFINLNPYGFAIQLFCYDQRGSGSSEWI